eukprot:5503149-Pyramimonas_sp.AAC.1
MGMVSVVASSRRLVDGVGKARRLHGAEASPEVAAVFAHALKEVQEIMIGSTGCWRVKAMVPD